MGATREPFTTFPTLSFIPVLCTGANSHHHNTSQANPAITLIAEASIPTGARLEPRRTDYLSHRLQNLTFGYELSSTPHSCKLRYRCKKGHLINCKAGTKACQICPSCMGQVSSPALNTCRRKLNICELDAIARARGGRLLSVEYVNCHAALLWRCSKHHMWRASAANIRNAPSWCPECARQNKKDTIQDMRLVARQFGGECVSQHYISEHVKLKWRCSEGHEFWHAPNNVKRSPGGARKPSWCRICRVSNRKLALH